MVAAFEFLSDQTLRTILAKRNISRGLTQSVTSCKEVFKLYALSCCFSFNQHDNPDETKNSAVTFADDTNIFRVVANYTNLCKLQNNNKYNMQETI